MNEVSRVALRESIEHWERMLDEPWVSRLGPDTCALCVVYRQSDADSWGCTGCPVRARTNRIGCEGTPYSRAAVAYDDWYYNYRWHVSMAVWGYLNWRIAAQKEIDFLKSLEG